jgi:hypothetical protein
VRSAVQTRECPVRVYQAHDKSDPILFPTCVIDEGHEDEFGGFVARSTSGDGDQDDEEGDERAVKG